MRTLIPVVCAAALLCGAAPAQENQQRRQGEMRQAKTRETMAFISHEIGAGEVGAAIVKGVPFSAETITEFRQTLGDGNIIERTSRGAIYRDSEGRTRREQPLSAGPGALGAVPEQVIIIRDPVAGIAWTLNPGNKTALRTRNIGQMRHAPEVNADARTPAQQLETIRHEPGSTQEENLGTQVVSGVQAHGSRVTTTLPTGVVGNVRPIEIVTERWYSPQLQTTVRTRRTDPRAGDFSFELTNIRQGDPSPSLFQVPPDYEIREGSVRSGVAGGVPGGVAQGVPGGVVPHGTQPRQQLRHSDVPPPQE